MIGGRKLPPNRLYGPRTRLSDRESRRPPTYVHFRGNPQRVDRRATRRKQSQFSILHRPHNARRQSDLVPESLQIRPDRPTLDGRRSFAGHARDRAAGRVREFARHSAGADELVGGVLSAGPTRLEAAARSGIPAIVTPGCLDMVNFLAPETVPARFQGRTFYQHNPQVTLMRTTPEECAQLGKILAEKLNLSKGPVTVLFPKRAISVISAPGQKFHDPAADDALLKALRADLRKNIELIEMDCAINDPVFAEACVKGLLTNLKKRTAR